MTTNDLAREWVELSISAATLSWLLALTECGRSAEDPARLRLRLYAV